MLIKHGNKFYCIYNNGLVISTADPLNVQIRVNDKIMAFKPVGGIYAGENSAIYEKEFTENQMVTVFLISVEVAEYVTILPKYGDAPWTDYAQGNKYTNACDVKDLKVYYPWVDSPYNLGEWFDDDGPTQKFKYFYKEYYRKWVKYQLRNFEM